MGHRDSWRTRGWPPLCGRSVLSSRQSRVSSLFRVSAALHLSQLVQGLSFANIIIVPDLFGIQSLWITSRDLGGVLGLEVKEKPAGARQPLSQEPA